MNDITITIDEETAAWARSRASERNMSLACFLQELISESKTKEYERAMLRFLAVKPKNLSNGEPYPRRDELYDRKVLRS